MLAWSIPYRTRPGGAILERLALGKGTVTAQKGGTTVKIVSTIARILLGVMFVVFGLNGFLLFFPPPPTLPPVMMQFDTALFASHYVWMTSAVQVICGVLLLVDRYVLLVTVVVAALLVNILTLHITMFPAGLPPALIAWTAPLFDGETDDARRLREVAWLFASKLPPA